MDAIEVNGIRSYGYTGFLAEERILGQWFQVDLTFWLDLQTSANSDNLEDTVDYRQTIEIVKHIIKTGKFTLVEKLAEVIAQQILTINAISQVRVRLCKPAPPIPDFTGSIVIDITRSK